MARHNLADMIVRIRGHRACGPIHCFNYQDGRMSHRVKFVLLLGLLMVSTAASAQVLPLGFYRLDPATGWTRSRALGISDDGRFIVGDSDNSSTSIATRWDLIGGTQTIGQPRSVAYALSGDGSVVAGGQNGVGYRWTQAGGIQPLPSLEGGNTSGPEAVSSDGRYIVGYSTTFAAAARAVRWDGVAAPQFLGFLEGGFYSTAEGINADGTKVVGYGGSSSGERAFLWTEQSGMQLLGTLPNYPVSRASAISRDGDTVVGYCQGVGGGPPVAWRWTELTGMTPLGAPEGFLTSFALATSADGRVIVGDCSGGDDNAPHPFLWTPELGPVNLETFLRDRGDDLTGWILGEAQGVSADGRTIIGMGRYQNERRAWVAVIPSPTGLVLIPLALWPVCHRLRSRRTV